MDEKAREVFRKVWEEGSTIEEVAEDFGLKPSAVERILLWGLKESGKVRERRPPAVYKVDGKGRLLIRDFKKRFKPEGEEVLVKVRKRGRVWILTVVGDGEDEEGRREEGPALLPSPGVEEPTG